MHGRAEYETNEQAEVVASAPHGGRGRVERIEQIEAIEEIDR